MYISVRDKVTILWLIDVFLIVFGGLWHRGMSYCT